MHKRGFTLVELIVAVSILSIGLLVIVHSLLRVSEALNSLENRAEAVSFLESKIVAMLTEISAKGKVENSNESGLVKVNNRQARWSFELLALGDEEGKEQVLKEARVSVFWQESGRGRDLVFSRYILANRIEK